MKKIIKYFVFLVALTLFVGINKVEALTVEEKWQQITESFESYSDGEYLIVSSDESSLTFTVKAAENYTYECKYTLENGIISHSDSYSCDYYTSDLIYEVVEVFGYDRNSFYDWFLADYESLSLEEDGFEIIGTMLSEESNIACDEDVGFGTASIFESMHCNEETGNLVFDSFIIEHVDIDLNRGFVTLGQEKTESNSKEPVKEKIVKVQDTSLNNSTVVMVAAGVFVILGIAVVYNGFKSKKKAK